MTLVTDVVFFNNAEFLVTMSQEIIFITVEHVPTCPEIKLSENFKSVWRYTFTVVNIVVVST